MAPRGIIQPYANHSNDHKHRRFPTAEILAGEPNITFHRDAYKAAHIAEEVRKLCTLRLPDLTPLQKQALEIYHTYPDYRLDRFSNQANHTVEELQPFLARYAHLFDSLFFANSLLHSGRLEIKISPKPHDESGLMGFTCPHPRKPNSKLIILYSHTESRLAPSKIIRTLLGTLVHEMIHALICLYGCQACQNDKSFEIMGHSGHGKVWLDIASQVEASIKSKRMLGLDVDVGVLPEVASEVMGWKIPIPEEKWLQSWGVSRRKVEEIIRSAMAASRRREWGGNADESVLSVIRGSAICLTIFKT